MTTMLNGHRPEVIIKNKAGQTLDVEFENPAIVDVTTRKDSRIKTIASPMMRNTIVPGAAEPVGHVTEVQVTPDIKSTLFVANITVQRAAHPGMIKFSERVDPTNKHQSMWKVGDPVYMTSDHRLVREPHGFKMPDIPRSQKKVRHWKYSIHFDGERLFRFHAPFVCSLSYDGGSRLAKLDPQTMEVRFRVADYSKIIATVNERRELQIDLNDGHVLMIEGYLQAISPDPVKGSDEILIGRALTVEGQHKDFYCQQGKSTDEYTAIMQGKAPVKVRRSNYGTGVATINFTNAEEADVIDTGIL